MGGRLYLAAVAVLAPLLYGAVAAVQGPPVYVSSGGAPSGACSGERVWITKTTPSDTYCCINGAWEKCNAGSPQSVPLCSSGQFLTADGGALICADERDPHQPGDECSPYGVAFATAISSTGKLSCFTPPGITGANYKFPMRADITGNTIDLSLDYCGQGQVLQSFDGGWTCQPANFVTPNTCPAFQFAYEIDQAGNLSCDTIPEVDPRVPHCPGGYSLHTTDDAGTIGCVEDVPPAYGQIEEAHQGSTITIASTGVYYPWVTGNCRDTLNMTCEQGYGVDAGTQLGGFLKIDRAGEYRVSFTSSLTASIGSQVVEADLFVVRSRGDTGVAGETEKCASSSKFGATDEQAVAFACVVSFAVGDLVGVRFDRDTGASTTLTINHASLTLTNIAPTVAVGTMSGNYVMSLATTGVLEGGAPASQGANLSLRLKDCGQGKMLRSYDGGWQCVDAPAETDPLSYHVGSIPLCAPGWVLKNDDAGVSCVQNVNLARGITASCGAGQFLRATDGGGTFCATETDPTIPSAWSCMEGVGIQSTGGGAWTCDDFRIKALLGQTNGQVPAWNGDAGAWVPSPIDPGINTLTPNKICRAGYYNQIECDQEPFVQKPTGCTLGQHPVWSGSDWACFGTYSLASDFTTSSQAWVSVSALSISAATGWLVGFECSLGYSISATAGGLALGVDGPVLPSYETSVFYRATINSSAAGTSAFCNSNNVAAGDGGCSPTTTTTAANTVYRASIKGYAWFTNVGTLAVRTHAFGDGYPSITIKAGSWCKFDYIR